MSSLLLLNGSPRGAHSNSMRMLARVAEGWEEAGGAAPLVLHLARPVDFEHAVSAFGEAHTVILGMPLYTDSMPAIVKAFIERLAPYVGDDGNPRLGFLVQSGFTEALHSRPLERYLAKLADRLGCAYAGTIVRGGGESLQVMPDEGARKLFGRLRTLGSSLARDGRFDETELARVAGVERFSPATAALLGVAFKLPPMQFYWNSQLKKSGAYRDRFAAPYV